jgi:hypothetical protein
MKLIFILLLLSVYCHGMSLNLRRYTRLYNHYNNVLDMAVELAGDDKEDLMLAQTHVLFMYKHLIISYFDLTTLERLIVGPMIKIPMLIEIDYKFRWKEGQALEEEKEEEEEEELEL